jgi:hypothetical protein
MQYSIYLINTNAAIATTITATPPPPILEKD